MPISATEATSETIVQVVKAIRSMDEDRKLWRDHDSAQEISAKTTLEEMSRGLQKTKNILAQLEEHEKQCLARLEAVQESSRAAPEDDSPSIFLQVMIQTEALRCLNTLVALPLPSTMDVAGVLERRCAEIQQFAIELLAQIFGLAEDRE
ncbi:hypothetical protein PM082_022736 [Marasmius tenuissimus]|nr:hypothetical protein PM082_022736 [Marasmius tenuissimus]